MEDKYGSTSDVEPKVKGATRDKSRVLARSLLPRIGKIGEKGAQRLMTITYSWGSLD